MIEIKCHGSKCPLCKRKVNSLFLCCTFELCYICAFRLQHDGRAPEEEIHFQIDQTLREINERMDKIEQKLEKI